MEVNEQDVQVKTAVELAEEKPIEKPIADEVPLKPIVLPLSKYSGKPIFPDRWTKKKMCQFALHNKQDIALFAEPDCPTCHGSGIASYIMGKQRVRKVCNCIQKLLKYMG